MSGGNNKQIKIGDIVGELTIISFEGYHIEPSGHKRKMVKVRCSCGNEYNLVATYLKRNNRARCIKCKGKSTRICKIGEKYDKLTVSGYTTINNKTMVACKCDCGTEGILIRATVLTSNQTNNCGCAPRGSWSGVGELSNTFFGRIKRNAAARGIKFNLTQKYLWRLFLEQNKVCALSGLPIQFSAKTFHKSTASLDRIDSSKPYIKGNVQWVHKDVNLMKMNLNEKRFIELCNLVSDKKKL